MKILLAILFPAIIFIACKKNDGGCTAVPPSAEAAQMGSFCTANGIVYIVDTNGIFYQIIDQGTGLRPNENSNITVSYTALNLDGKILEDKTDEPVTVPLNQFIEGWRIALPYIQKGGRIKMIIPSVFAYGCTGTKTVAPNAPLYYDVVLLDVQ